MRISGCSSDGWSSVRLESVTAGVISVDESGRVQLMNSSAQRLLTGREEGPALGIELSAVAPEIHRLIQGGLKSGIVTQAKGDDLLTLAVRIAPERGGHVITFEDITRQLLDQRQAARSEERRVGKEGVSTCRSRWSPDH